MTGVVFLGDGISPEDSAASPDLALIWLKAGAQGGRGYAAAIFRYRPQKKKSASSSTADIVSSPRSIILLRMFLNTRTVGLNHCLCRPSFENEGWCFAA
jgi:hypothetical protein